MHLQVDDTTTGEHAGQSHMRVVFQLWDVLLQEIEDGLGRWRWCLCGVLLSIQESLSQFDVVDQFLCDLQ